MVIIRLMGGFAGELPLGMLMQKSLTIRGTLLRARSLEEQAAATRVFEQGVLPHLASGRIHTVVDKAYAMADVAEAHRRMEAKENFGRILLRT